MRVAALYDIHGNLPALRAVLADVAREGVGMVVVGGDVAAGPLPAETVTQLMALGDGARFVSSNADREVVAAYDQGRRDLDAEQDPSMRAASYSAGQISEPQPRFLAGFAPDVVLDIDGLGTTLFCHGSPRSDAEMITTATPEPRLRDMLDGVSEPVVVCGHTHRQFDRRVNGWRVINAGSVGMPYEGTVGAYWALLGPTVELHRTEYDLDEGLKELRAGGLPDVDEMLRESLLEPMNADEVADLFEGQATGGN
jgi:predicted phosphodiesterase